VELEWQIRCLLQKPNKDDAELEKEEALIARLVTLVEQRNEIVDCLEMDRKREADEDQSVRERRQMMTGKPLSYCINCLFYKVSVLTLNQKIVMKHSYVEIIFQNAI
jgi:Bivalent Mical/EHBP Rab binding domain